MDSLRNSKGQWAKGNPLRFQQDDPRTVRAASNGGAARAQRLTPERRSAIARKGMDALIQKRFKGDRARCLDWLGQNGRWAYDEPCRQMSIGVFPPPEPLPESEQ